MHFLTTQGINCTTFTRPPLDESVTIPDIFEKQASNSPNHPLFVFADGLGQVRTVLYPEGVQAIRRAARITADHYLRLEDQYLLQDRGKTTPPTLGILAVGDTISYFCLMVGIMRLGCTVFPISTRNSPLAVAHLIRKTGVLQLFVSPDPAMQRLTTEALQILAQDGYHVEVLEFPQFQDLFVRTEENLSVPTSIDKLQLDNPALILHSSGSTAFPKPICLTHRNILQWGCLPYHGEVDICAKVLAAHSLPLFHAMGAIILGWTCCAGVIIGCFKPSVPPTIPTPDSVLEGLIATKSNFIFCVPSFIEHWAQSPDNIPILKGLDTIVYAGAPMSKVVGDQLAKQGVPLIPFYGATETGCASMFIPAEKPSVDEWEYFRFSPHMDTMLMPQEGLDNVFELVIVAKRSYRPSVINTMINGREAYATNDLLLQHPTDVTRWRVFGRADDQLMLSTGEKTNPVPLEAILVHDPRIDAAVMFGRGRFQNGVLVAPKAEYSFDTSDEKKLAEFRNAIWPSVEKVNRFAPSHSRLFKEMIVVANLNKPLEFTAKGTPRRQIALNLYEDEIETAYNAVKNSAQAELVVPTTWTSESTIKFIRATVNRTLVNPVSDNDDIFQHGCDSLQATRVRNTLLRALRESTGLSVSWHTVPHSFVYTYPSISKLSDFITRLLHVKEVGLPSQETLEQAKVQEMEALVTKYATGFKSHIPSAQSALKQEQGEVILLTGSTGRFGCYLLTQLIANTGIARIFALNRSHADVSLDERQRIAFVEWGLDPALLRTSKLRLLETDPLKPLLGLEREVFEEIRGSITGIVHNAWRVDFNLTLSSFEPMIKGARDLIDLSLSSPRAEPPFVLFTSSISVMRNHISPEPFSEISISDPRIAIGTGYSEGKWVTEHLLEAASKTTKLRTIIVRVGQLCGNSADGCWNKKEWVPNIIRAGQTVGCLPLRDEEVAWVPADVAASALLEMRHAHEQFLHLVHPKPVYWSTVFKITASTLRLPLVSYAEWLARLEALQRSEEGTHKNNPVLGLLEYFRALDRDTERMAPYIGTKRACQVSPILMHADRLAEQGVMKWVDYWQRIDFLDL